MKNRGEIRFQIALERIFWHDLRAFGQSFLSYQMGEITRYALTGKLSSKNPTWQPTPEDIYQIDCGTPRGYQTIKEEYKKEEKKKYVGSGWK